MKRIVALILILAFCLSLTAFLPAYSAAAEDTSYYEITKDDTYLYTNSISPEPQFKLPRTYYVELVKANVGGSGYHQVKYNGIPGLVKADEVSATTVANVQIPYYPATFISANAGQYLYANPDFSTITPIQAEGLALIYLGKIDGEQKNYKSKTWFAVQYSNQVYYIHSQMTENIDLLETSIPLHPNAATATSAEVSNGGTTTEESAQPASSVDIVRILLIVGIFVPIVIILVVLFRPPKKRSRNKSGDDEGGY